MWIECFVFSGLQLYKSKLKQQIKLFEQYIKLILPLPYFARMFYRYLAAESRDLLFFTTDAIFYFL